MKKGIFSMAVLAAMCVGGYFGHSAYQESMLTDLELANVEALCDDESDLRVMRVVPCPKYYGNQCKWSSEKNYYRCYHLSYCN